MMAEEMKGAEAEVHTPTTVPAPAVGTGEKNQRGNKRATARVLADGPTSSARMVRALDHAEALLASMVRAAPTSSAAMLA
jgi:hypothetical protein